MTILLTGSSRGIGAAIFDTLTAAGRSVIGHGTASGIPADFDEPGAAPALWHEALTRAGGEIDVFPVNYIVDERTLLFRTAPGTKLAELTAHDAVAFEVDGYGEHDAWSVVVKGTAARLDHQAEIDRADSLPLVPWIPTLKYTYVRITPTSLSGRRFRRGPEPERYDI